MKLNSAEIKGFASFKEYVQINIPLGITGISGSIEAIEGRSNGAGKSSLLMSLPFALFGTGTFDRMEEVWNDKLTPSDDAFVRWNFDLMGNNYIVERGRKKKASYLDVSENGKRVKEGNTESQEFIYELLGMESKMFLSSAFTAQKDLAAFIETDPSIRKSYMDVVTDLGLWRSASKRSSTIAKETKSSFETILGETKELDKLITEREAVIRSLECELQNINTIKNKRDEKATKVATLQNVTNIRVTLVEYESLKTKGTQEVANLTSKKIETENSLKKVASDFTKAKEEFSLLSDLDSSAIQSSLDVLANNLDTITTQMSFLNKQMQDTIEKIAYTTAEITLLEKNKTNLSEGICDQCKQPVTKEHIEKLLAEAAEKSIQLSQTKETFERTKGSIQKEIDSYSAAAMQTQEEIKSNKDKLDKYVELHTKMEIAEETYKKLNDALVFDLKNISTQILNTQVCIEEYDTKINDLKKQIPENVHIDISVLSQELDALNRTVEDLIRKQGKLQELEESTEIQKNVLKDKKNKLKKLQENLYYLEVLGEAFRDIPAELFKESVVAVENYANEIIRAIYHKFKIKIYEDETKKNRPLMIAFEVDGKYRNYKLLSGGQQSICAIGLRMGFNRILSQRSKVSLNFLILDEIFGSLDKFNREEVLRMLNGLTKFFPQILVITHTEEDHIFPKLIKVRMDSMGNSFII